MLRTLGTRVEKLNSYDGAQKVVFTVLTGGVTIYVASSAVILRQLVGGVQQGTPITNSSQVALDCQGEIFWRASAEGVQVDVLETGAI